MRTYARVWGCRNAGGPGRGASAWAAILVLKGQERFWSVEGRKEEKWEDCFLGAAQSRLRVAFLRPEAEVDEDGCSASPPRYSLSFSTGNDSSSSPCVSATNLVRGNRFPASSSFPAPVLSSPSIPSTLLCGRQNPMGTTTKGKGS